MGLQTGAGAENDKMARELFKKKLKVGGQY
jgi:hypothetical protein